VLAQDGKIAVFNPTADLDANSWYDVNILTGIQSTDEKKLENNETWSFKTESAPVSFLKILGRYPAQNQENIKRSTDVVVNFSESLDSATVNKVNFIVKKHSDGTKVDGDAKVLPEDDKIAVFDPTADLESSTAYDVTILAAIQSKDGKKLEKDETWFFEAGTN